MTNKADTDHLLEIYKLHSELANQVSQRREGANRLYVSLLVALVVFLAALLRFGGNEIPERLVFGVCGGIGVLLSLSWFLVIRSYKQLNSEKFRVLHELEARLPFQFFVEEWDPKKKGEKSNLYRQLTSVEVSLPLIFGLLFALIVIYSMITGEPGVTTPVRPSN